MTHPQRRGAIACVIVALAATACSTPTPPFTPPAPSQSAAEALTGFDNKSNGVVDDSTHDADRDSFDEVEDIADGLGPLYNAQSCRECHQNPISGGPSQVSELRVGHLGPNRLFQSRASWQEPQWLPNSPVCTSRWQAAQLAGTGTLKSPLTWQERQSARR